MTYLIPGAEHVEVVYDKPGLCPECLNLEITGRGGGQVQLVERDGKWVCPRSGPSLAQQYANEGVSPSAAFGIGIGVGSTAFRTVAFGVGSGWLLWNWFRRKKDGKSSS
jgi:hypothetical protein